MNFLNRKKTVICFLRHGQTDWNLNFRMQGREEIPLNETGIKQAQNAAKGFREFVTKTGIKFDKIISSPLSRATVTAKTIADEIGYGEILTDKRVLERDFGLLSGYTYEDFSVAYKSNPDMAKTVESKEEIIERIKSFLDDNVKKGEKVLVVAHGGIIRMIARENKKSKETEEKINKEPVENCHIVVCSYDGGEIFIEGYNINPFDFADFVLNDSEKA